MTNSSKSPVSVSDRIANARQAVTSNMRETPESQKALMRIYGESTPSVVDIYSAYDDYPEDPV